MPTSGCSGPPWWPGGKSDDRVTASADAVRSFLTDRPSRSLARVDSRIRLPSVSSMNCTSGSMSSENRTGLCMVALLLPPALKGLSVARGNRTALGARAQQSSRGGLGGIIRRVTRRVIFLDIDGVLAPIRRWDRYGDLDPACIQRLNEIVEGGDADVVVSSTWRHGKTVAELQKLLDGQGFAGCVLD